MWLLITSTEKFIYLKPNIPVSIGRKKGDILLPHDASISKLHASIVVKKHTELIAGKPTSLCVLKDEGSKYGTYISKNGTFEKVTTHIHLKDQDIIRIGLQREIFTIKYIPIITMISALQDRERDKLLKIMGIIDGIITTDWNKYCTHLTVVEPKLTQKVAISLAAGIPIVTVDYWDAVNSVIEKGDPLPQPYNFIPEISEQYISKEMTSLSPDDERKVLFADMTFNFFSLNQYDMYKTMIRLASGKSVLFNSNNKHNDVSERNCIFVQYSSNDSTQLTENYIQEYDYICKKLKTYKCRVIPESEIPLAILYCSTRRYCNPRYNFENVLKRRERPTYNLPETLVVDTQDFDILIENDCVVEDKFCHRKSTNYIPETLEDNDDDVSIQDNPMSQENLDSSEEMTQQTEYTASKQFFIPETIESFSFDSQRNTNCHIKQDSKYDSFKVQIGDDTKETHTSVNATFQEEYTTNLSDEDNKRQVVKSHGSFVSHICIPETIDDNYSDSIENSNKKSETIGSPLVLNFSQENYSNDVSIKKQLRKDNEDMLMAVQKLSKTEAQKNVQSHEIKRKTEIKREWIIANSSVMECLQETDIQNKSRLRIRSNPPGKTFQKANVKIPGKRIRLVNIAEEDSASDSS